jgi:hypothetical protein
LAGQDPFHLPTLLIAVHCSSKPLQFSATQVCRLMEAQDPMVLIDPDTIPTRLPQPPKRLLGLAGAAPPPDHLDRRLLQQQATTVPDNLSCRLLELRIGPCKLIPENASHLASTATSDRLARRKPLHLPTTLIIVYCSSKPPQSPTTSVAVWRNFRTYS